MNINIQNTGEEKDFTAITAFYQDSRLYSVGTYNENAAASEKFSFGIVFTAPESGSVTAKTMLWNGLGYAKPLSSAMTLPVAQ